MDDGRQYESGKQKVEYYGGVQQWNMVAQHQGKESNALAMNHKIMSILNERDNAIKERNKVLAETKELLDARDAAILERNKALSERDAALMERDNALAAFQSRGNIFPLGGGNQRGAKRIHQPVSLPANMAQNPNYMGEGHISDAFPLSIITSETVKSCQGKGTKEYEAALSKTSKPPCKGKKVGEDLNRQVCSDAKKFKSEWDSQEAGLNLINFDESMPVPVCSCTGSPHQCYKWGNGGWQSSCCTTTMSSHPLPQMPNKPHARVGGRKMSGSVFTRLLSRLAAAGHDLSMPLDLKDYWARHGTNRYITIK